MTHHKALLFSINGVKLGIDLSHIQEVIFNLQLIRPPESPSLLRGFAQLGSHLYPIIRLEDLLKLQFSSGSHWQPDKDLSTKILLMKSPEIPLGFYIDNDTDFVEYRSTELVRLPKSHVLNDCVDYVIPRPPPEPSIVLLEPNKVLITKEKQLLTQLTERELNRIQSANFPLAD